MKPLPDRRTLPVDFASVPTGQLIRALILNARALVEEELRFARRELGDDARRALSSSVLIAAGGALLFAGLLALSAGVIALLAFVFPLWGAALIWGAILVVGGAVLALDGLRMIAKLRQRARDTATTIGISLSRLRTDYAHAQELRDHPRRKSY